MHGMIGKENELELDLTHSLDDFLVHGNVKDRGQFSSKYCIT